MVLPGHISEQIGAAFDIDCHAHYQLRQIGSVILAETLLAESFLPAPALGTDRKLASKSTSPTSLKRSRLRSKRASSMRSFVQRGLPKTGAANGLAQPGHSPVEMMKFDPFGPRNPAVLLPEIGCAITARGKEPGAIPSDRRTVPNQTRAGAARPTPRRFASTRHFPSGARKPSSAPILLIATGSGFSGGMRVEHPEILGKSQSAAQQPVELSALLKDIEASKGGDNALAEPLALPIAFADLKILAVCGAFESEKHRCARHKKKPHVRMQSR